MWVEGWVNKESKLGFHLGKVKDHFWHLKKKIWSAGKSSLILGNLHIIFRNYSSCTPLSLTSFFMCIFHVNVKRLKYPSFVALQYHWPCYHDCVVLAAAKRRHIRKESSFGKIHYKMHFMCSWKFIKKTITCFGECFRNYVRESLLQNIF